MVIVRPSRIDTLNLASNYMPEPNHPIEIRWLPSDMIQNEFDRVLKQRWDRLSIGNISSN